MEFEILSGLARTNLLKVTDRIFAAKYSVGVLTSDHIIAFADDQLSEGVYSDYYLEIIDEKQPYLKLLNQKLELAFAELDIAVPSADDAMWLILHYHMNIMASLNINRGAQFRLLMDDMAIFELDEGKSQYFGIQSIYDCFYSHNSESNIDMRIASQNWLKKYDDKIK